MATHTTSLSGPRWSKERNTALRELQERLRTWVQDALKLHLSWWDMVGVMREEAFKASIERQGANYTQSAHALGVSRVTLWRAYKRYRGL